MNTLDKLFSPMEDGERQIVFSPQPPVDRSKYWIRSDEETGIPLGKLQVWDADKQAWRDAK